ncbi:MAG TPA: hypothetical protein GYA08_15380 [Chloroflexi bacterium]|nr:hypothetical protein [Chloroflexota bacterium]
MRLPEIAALAGRSQQALLDIEQVVARAESMLRKARATQDDDYYDGIALNLHSFYAGVETIFEDIARTLDGVIPDSPNWHQELLKQMAAEITSVRPAVISVQTRYCLDEYRSFRHLVRNLYTFHLRTSRVAELCDGLRSCYAALQADIMSFMQIMQSLDEPSDGEAV